MVVGIVAILALTLYWYLFSPQTLIPVSEEAGIGVAPEISRGEVQPEREGPDNRTVIVETPRAQGRSGTTDQAERDSTSDSIPTGSSPAPTLDSGALAIQVGAFSKPEGAAKLMTELRGKGFSSAQSSAEGMYRVFVGDYSSRDEASEDLARLKSSGYSGYLRTVP